MNLWCRQVFYVLTCNHGPTVNVLCVLCFIVLTNLVEVSGTTRGDNKVLFKVIQGFLSVYYVSHWERADFPRTVSVARTPRQSKLIPTGGGPLHKGESIVVLCSHGCDGGSCASGLGRVLLFVLGCESACVKL